jgi:hypothetical protein
MTSFRTPPVVVDHDSQWITVDLRGDLREWARGKAREVGELAVAGGLRVSAKQVARVLEDAGAVARRSGDAAMALLLYPSVEHGLRGLVRFLLVDTGGRDEADAIEDMVGDLVRGVTDGEPPEVTGFASPAGAGRRVRQRYSHGEGPERPVWEQVFYAWAFPDYSAGLVMTTVFTDLLEAGRWLPALDKLAAGVELAPGEAPR